LHRRKNLIFWRIEQRLRQKDMCERLGVTSSHYSNLERGISDPSYDLLVRFQEVFKVNNVLELFEKENSKWQQ
jgi:transcriptional regulator with XRE-family HTH domain